MAFKPDKAWENKTKQFHSNVKKRRNKNKIAKESRKVNRK